MKKSKHTKTPSIPHGNIIPHTIALKNVDTTILYHVVILPYLVFHTLHYATQQKTNACLRKKSAFKRASLHSLP